MMEKRGVIEPGRTPPEEPEKQAEADLEKHATTRLIDAVKEQLRKPAEDEVQSS